MTEKNHKIISQISINASIAQVWEFLMSEEKMKNWFEADEFLIDVSEGGKIKIPLTISGEECVIEGEIGLILPQEKFVFTWIERDKHGDAWFNNTTVTIALEEIKNGTKFTLIHDGFKYLPEEIFHEVYDRYQAYWHDGNLIARFSELVSKQNCE
ncbi:MAG: SRPBCC family protein [Chloroflexota bacterium]